MTSVVATSARSPAPRTGPGHLLRDVVGLARARCNAGDRPARWRVEQIISHLAQGTLEGADEPFRIYLTCYRVLCAAGDPRAAAVLDTALARLLEQAERINDMDARRSFLDNVPAHRELLAEKFAHYPSITGG
jgi:hypothetical protein